MHSLLYAILEVLRVVHKMLLKLFGTSTGSRGRSVALPLAGSKLVDGHILFLLLDDVYARRRNVLRVLVVVSILARLLACLLVLTVLLLAEHVHVRFVGRYPPIIVALVLKIVQASFIQIVELSSLELEVLVQQGRLVLLERVDVQLLRAVQVLSDRRADGLAAVDVVACTAVVSGSIYSRATCIACDTSADCKTCKAGIQAILQLVDHAAVHSTRIRASSHLLHCLVLIWQIRVLVLETI